MACVSPISPPRYAIDRIDEHAVADAPALDARAELVDLAGQVEAHDHGIGILMPGMPRSVKTS